jgi:Ca2+-binding RTX toxin-like protein
MAFGRRSQGSRNAKPGRRIRDARSLRVESLENRIVLAAGIRFDSRSGIVTIEGSQRNDSAIISENKTRLVVTLRTPVASFSRAVNLAAVKRIGFAALGGDDSFTNNSRVPSNVDGGVGNDTLVGGSGTDRFVGGVGKDRLSGRGGNDVLSGGLSDDSLDGGDGNDTLDGGDGIDTLLGGGGADSLVGGNGGDLLDGGDDNDSLNGGSSDDQLYGGAGDDWILGEAGDDKLWGGTGNDYLDSGSDWDVIDGDDGDDILKGGDGIDHLLGGNGRDVLHGGGDDDNVDGEADDDIQYGDGGNDRVDGGSGNDTLYGGDGNDEMIGNFGDDILQGDAGDDWLDGNEGRDSIRGGDGNDDCFDDDSMEDHGSSDDGDNALARGNDGPATPILFDSTGLSIVTGTSSNRRDRSYYSFRAAADSDLMVRMFKDAPGRYADLELEEVGSAEEHLLELEPRSEATSFRRVGLRQGRTYLMRIRSQNMDPVGFVVELKLEPTATV